jgi:hypothetical protein
MSIGPAAGVAGSAAGAPLSQTKGNETERSAQASAARERQAQTDQAADNAAGIGQTEEYQETSDRDADGRRLWERAAGRTEDPDGSEEPHESNDDDSPKAVDPTGQSGSHLDLSG